MRVNDSKISGAMIVTIILGWGCSKSQLHQLPSKPTSVLIIVITYLCVAQMSSGSYDLLKSRQVALYAILISHVMIHTYDRT